MVTKNIKYLSFVVAAIMFVALMFTLLGTGMTAYAASPVGGADGIYTVPVDLSGLTMGADNFSSSATVEKSGNNYYLTFGHSSNIGNLTLNLGDKQVGTTMSSDSGWTYYTYTLSETNVQSSLSFSAHINAMDRDVSFTIKLSLSSATRTGDYFYDGERPAEFVPVISTEAGSEYQMQQGSVFPVPAATAFLGTEECEVAVTAFYGEEEVAITDNCFTLENVGVYRLIYRASSPSYKTSVGNDTYTEYNVAISSSAGGSSLAKFEDLNGVLPEGTAIMPSRITEGNIFSQAAEKMKKIADNFEVYGVKLISSEGGDVEPDGSITLYIQIDNTYDRSEAVVYHMDENGNLTKLDTSGYGRYVKIETDKTGTFIVCIPGVAFVMPMWGYAVILVACVIVLAAAVTITIIVVKKRKKAKKMRL